MFVVRKLYSLINIVMIPYIWYPVTLNEAKLCQKHTYKEKCRKLEEEEVALSTPKTCLLESYEAHSNETCSAETLRAPTIRTFL